MKKLMKPKNPRVKKQLLFKKKTENALVKFTTK